MKKFNRALIMTLVSLLVVQPVSALSTEVLALNTQKETVVKNNLINLNSNRIKEQSKQYPYGYTINFVDKFGNYLNVQTKNNGNGYSIGSMWDKPLNVVGTATRAGYKSTKYDVKANKKGEQVVKNVVLEPTKINNIIMGSVELPEGRSKENLFIEVKTESKLVNGKYVRENIEAYIKVKPDGTFKMYNLPDGEYTFEVVYGNMERTLLANSGRNNAMTMDVYAPFLSESVKVSGNLNKTFKVVDTGAEDFGYNNYFGKIDYSDPELAKVTPDLEMSEEMKKAVDAAVNDKKDLSTLDEIGKFIKTYFKDKPDQLMDIGATRSFDSVSRIEKDGQGWLDDCREYALVYSAIARYKGIPTTYVHAISSKHLESGNSGSTGHEYLEAYVDGKWVLVDSTQMLVDDTYDKDDNSIFSNVGAYTDDVLYVFAKSKSIVGTTILEPTPEISDDLKEVLDRTLINTNTENRITR